LLLPNFRQIRQFLIDEFFLSSRKSFMRKYIYCILIFSTSLGAQNKRFTYEYSAVSDSTNKDDVQKELLVLDVNKNGSIFYSLEKFKSDSIQYDELQKQANSDAEIINVKSTYKGKILYTISKNYPGFETFLHTALANDRYKVTDERKQVWKILPEKQKIGEFETQKAETNSFGRKWVAWFAPDLPIQDGPYKFHGLPGLIIKNEDKTTSHSFELKGISDYVDNRKLEIDEERNVEKEIAINYSKYKKLALEQFNDPSKSLREMMNRAGQNFKIFGPDGREMKPAEVIKQRELEAKEKHKKNNNPIELDLLQ